MTSNGGLLVVVWYHPLVDLIAEEQAICTDSDGFVLCIEPLESPRVGILCYDDHPLEPT